MMRARICSGVAIGLGKLLLRRGLHYQRAQLDARASAVDRQSRSGRTPAERAVVDDYLLAIDHTRGAPASNWTRGWPRSPRREPYREPVGWLRCFRGIDTLTAMLILAELHDFRRFPSPRGLMAYLGLVPGEDSSGEKHRRGRITRTGQRAGPAAAGRNGVALSTPAGRRGGAHATTQRTTEPSDCDRGQGAAATVSALPTLAEATQARAEDRGGDRARAGRLPVGGAPTGTGAGEVTARCATDERSERHDDAGQ